MSDLAVVLTTPIATSLEGYAFEPTNKVWKISHQHKLSLGWADRLLGMDLANSFFKVLEHYAKKYSASYTKNLCCRFQHFALQRYQVSGQRDPAPSLC